MSKSKSLLIIAPYQFGELSDCYYWAKYTTLSGVKTSYIGYRYRSRDINPRICPGVKTISIPRFNNRILLGLVFYFVCIFEIIWHNYQNVIICRMPYCEILAKLFKRRNIILDIRTLSVSKDVSIRDTQNKKTIAVKKLFKTCTIISNEIGEIVGKPYQVLPLGAEPLSSSKKEFDSLRFFYIGTFNGRCLSVFINGLALYQQHFNTTCTFDIVGGGDVDEETAIHTAILKSGVKGVTLHGYLNHDEATRFFDHCNIGVCYVPITDYYQFQPPTKLYEYLLAGMACIATRTYSNSLVVNEQNGILIGDDEESVFNGIVSLTKRMSTFQSSAIVNDSLSYHWEKIIQEKLLPLLK